jgi:Domain of unknown function (DUF4249)
MKKYCFLGLALSFVLTACTKEIEIDLNTANPLLVVEAALTDQNQPHTVRLSKTVNFSETNNFPAVQGANVQFADNTGAAYPLTETSAGVYQTLPFAGVPGRTYTLTINAEGKTYTAQSTMPAKVELLGIVPIENAFGSRPGDTNPDPRPQYIAIPVYKDPEGLGNNYRFVQTVNQQKDKNFIIGNDNINDGLINQRPIFSFDMSIRQNDTLSVELQCIDKANYDYLFSLNASSGNGPGGGTTPSNPVTNLSNNALGYFSAHTSQTVTIVVP